MPATRNAMRSACIAFLLVVGGLASGARAQEATKPAPVSTIGSPVPLPAEQVLALQAKRAADPGTLHPPLPAGRPEKLVGAAPGAASRVAPDAAPGVAKVPGKPSPAPAISNAPGRRASWQSVASSLGAIPRPEWSAPWAPAKPADVTVSRPRRPSDATSRATATPGPGGAR